MHEAKADTNEINKFKILEGFNTPSQELIEIDTENQQRYKFLLFLITFFVMKPNVVHINIITEVFL